MDYPIRDLRCINVLSFKMEFEVNADKTCDCAVDKKEDRSFDLV